MMLMDAMAYPLHGEINIDLWAMRSSATFVVGDLFSFLQNRRVSAAGLKSPRP
ncbi:MAG TPA: hypothetical protein PKV15_08480 [Syntrophomonadaceae bacterium]|jgi:hypothetical protein|nr:hypothetical protein [Syntrophomonadaceae bacterium]HRX21633.1 hypothetical protein [Syntrophomonadaceae bacterium]